MVKKVVKIPVSDGSESQELENNEDFDNCCDGEKSELDTPLSYEEQLDSNAEGLSNARSHNFKKYKNEVDWKDKYLRAMAEFDNATKTIPKRIKEGVYRFKSNHFSNLIEVVDGFDMARNHFGESDESWLKGFDSLYRLLINLLEKEGVKRIESKGKLFDPNLHEAVQTIENEVLQDNIIVEELRSGWQMDQKTLRPASVIVVKNI